MRLPSLCISALIMVLAMGSAIAEDGGVFRLQLKEPILFTGEHGETPEPGSNGGIVFSIPEAVNGRIDGRLDGALSVRIEVHGLEAEQIVAIASLPPGALWLEDENAYGSGWLNWPSAAIGAWHPVIEVRDGDENLLASANIDLLVHPPLTASVSATSYEVEIGDELSIPATAVNLIGEAVWSSQPATLPEWLTMNAQDGIVSVDTSEANTIGTVSLTATDQFDYETATTLPFSVTVNGRQTGYWVSLLGAVNSDNGVSLAVSGDSILVAGDSYAPGLGGTDILLAKYETSGKLQWKKGWGTSKADSGQGVAIGGDGSVFLTGHVAKQGTSENSFFVSGHDANGIMAWKNSFGNVGYEYSNGIVVNSNGALRAVGQSVTGGRGNYDIMTVAYTQSGGVAWRASLGGTADDRGYKIAAAASGAVVVTGYTRSVSVGGLDIILAKYAEDGTRLWHAVLGGSQNDYGEDVAVASDGSIYVAGTSDSNSVLAKYDADGNMLWYKGLVNAAFKGVAVGGDGIYVVGETGAFGAGGLDVLVAKYNAQGDLLWQKTLGGAGNDRGTKIEVGQDGAIYIVGSMVSGGATGYDVMLARLPMDDIGALEAGGLKWMNANHANLPTVLTPNRNPAGITNTPSPAGLVDTTALTTLTEGDVDGMSDTWIDFRE